MSGGWEEEQDEDIKMKSRNQQSTFLASKFTGSGSVLHFASKCQGHLSVKELSKMGRKQVRQ